jgi:hypothetical protein
MGRGGRHYVHRMLGGLFGGSADAPAPDVMQLQAPASPVPESVGGDYSMSNNYGGYGQSSMPNAHKRKEMASAFEVDPRERALAPHLRGRGYDPMMPPPSPPLQQQHQREEFYEDPSAGGFGLDPDDRYVREPPMRDHRSPEERYDSAMPEIPPERISRRRPSSPGPWDDDRDHRMTPTGGPTPGVRTRHVFRS